MPSVVKEFDNVFCNEILADGIPHCIELVEDQHFFDCLLHANNNNIYYIGATATGRGSDPGSRIPTPGLFSNVLYNIFI